MEQELFIILFKVFITGFVIFAFQQTFVELWIKPLKEFEVVLKKLESFLIRYAYLSQAVWGQNEILDQELLEGRNKLREYAGDLIAGYTNMFCLEKLWLKYVRKINIKQAKKSLIRLSNLLGNTDNTKTLDLRAGASKEIDNIRKYLKFDFSD